MSKQSNDAADDWRSGKTTAERGYGGRWQKARLTFLRKNPLCSYCQDRGKVVAATVVDHKVPHKGDQSLFWDRSNWQPLCAQCHSSTKQRIEKSGVTFGCNADGSPIDPNHHWAK
ncbi:HNH endonuclease [Pseudomonas nitroreducens]|uniref:HNH endonuclease n=1 Tax=Pseudomonas nitroreducens TaxID=46680 RepID=UPI0014728D94|nr:HNH endonuclease signature motif containing protein [Pseudomonas nitroreducens]NMZ77376.1 HNH endonuclease [Pseudomonas nitroreducens]